MAPNTALSAGKKTQPNKPSVTTAEETATQKLIMKVTS